MTTPFSGRVSRRSLLAATAAVTSAGLVRGLPAADPASALLRPVRFGVSTYSF